MKKQMQTMDDRQAEVGKEKKPYQTPTLKKLGNVQQLTKGTPLLPGSDDTVFSI